MTFFELLEVSEHLRQANKAQITAEKKIQNIYKLAQIWVTTSKILNFWFNDLGWPDGSG